VPTFLQLAAVAALEGSQDCVKQMVEVYRRRREYFVKELNKLGWPVPMPRATMYVWARLPEPFFSMGSLPFAEKLIQETGVAVAPGVGFGKEGEGYVRFAMVTHDDRFYDAALRIRKFFRKYGVGVPAKGGRNGAKATEPAPVEKK
jgi:aspartate/methionine/tyrosine aminotransferase